MNKVATEPKDQKNGTLFNIEKIYVKDISFEAPSIPEIFKEEWKPAIALNMDITSNKLAADVYEVALKLTITNKINDKVAFLVELSQAGIFSIKGVQDDQLKAFIGIICPQILFPYAREAISDLTGRGGFPPLYLAPINFESLYQKNTETRSAKESK
jgi:preprotein translocase subunit SecB